MGSRANINLDNDAYSFASAYASAKGIPLGAAVSELLRKQEQQSQEQRHETSPRVRVNEYGMLVKARTGRVVTSEMVKQSSEDDLA